MPVKLFAVICICILSACSGGQQQSETINNDTDMPSGDSSFVKGYFFTTPAPFAECHASTILHLQNGEFMAAWFGGQKEGTDDVGIWLVKGKPGNWTAPVEVAKIREDAHWNPVLFQAP